MNSDWIILDTNVVSYLMRGGILAEKFSTLIQGRKTAISFITVGELYFGAEKAGWGKNKRLHLETVLKNLTVIMYNHEIAKIFGSIVAEREHLGRPISYHDAWIAACALRYNVPFATHNIKDFEKVSKLEVLTING